jgi:hypothetical protein
MGTIDELLKIKLDLQELTQLIDCMQESGVCQIEKDIALGKIRKVYEKLLLFDIKSEEILQLSEEIKETKEEIIEEIIADAIEEIEDNEVSNKQEVMPELNIPEAEAEPEQNEQSNQSEINETLNLQDTNQDLDKVLISKKDNNENIEQIEQITTNKNEPGQTIADQFQNEKKSLNDQAALNHKVKDLASKLKDQPIEDLKKAINLNDRFLFTKELFEGNAIKYNQAIEELNKFENLDQAMEYINTGFAWDMEKESFKKFIELVYRRYIQVLE